jgi:transcriptional regulator with GAF, ATPase, and Fis domain
MFRKLLRQSPKDIAEAKILRDIEHTAFLQISSVISAHKDLKTILEVIVRESLNCLKANRSTIFLMHEKSGILKIQCAHASDSLHKQVDLHEEGEIAQKTLRQNKPFLLRRPKDFSDFFKYNERERKITSLMSIPLSSNGKPMGVLSAVAINEEYGFDEKSLQFFSSFANLASTPWEWPICSKR